MTKKQIDEIVTSVSNSFRTFGGGKTSQYNPIAAALADSPPQFSAGVGVREVVLHVLKMAKKKSFTKNK